LIHLESATILSPAASIAWQPAIFGLSYQPFNATPEVRCFWLPEPAAGQRSCSPTLIFLQPGEQSVEVWVVQGNSPPIYLQTNVIIQPPVGSLYLPTIFK